MSEPDTDTTSLPTPRASFPKGLGRRKTKAEGGVQDWFRAPLTASELRRRARMARALEQREGLAREESTALSFHAMMLCRLLTATKGMDLEEMRRQAPAILGASREFLELQLRAFGRRPAVGPLSSPP